MGSIYQLYMQVYNIFRYLLSFWDKSCVIWYKLHKLYKCSIFKDYPINQLVGCDGLIPKIRQ